MWEDNIGMSIKESIRGIGLKIGIPESPCECGIESTVS